MNADQISAILGLEPLPEEGGMWAQTWLDEHGSAIYFLMQPDDFSAMHRLNRTELWHHYSGAPVEFLLLDPDGSVGTPVLGSDLTAGERPFLAIPTGVWMGASTMGDWSLVGTTLAPPYDPDGFELGTAEQLIEGFPEAAARITDLIRDDQP
ncbi:MAG: cupin domain-containing protein [Acidimicrobiales bacterium]|jgi:predicted cupin superfamily sugar epimerase|nr:cupin domain-containing protein [Acidimicrobiales bacterium]|tara:strand:+ start:494 stop:949 length:456 start_codon:yes stop_codon:yes gene_type:complete